MGEGIADRNGAERGVRRLEDTLQTKKITYGLVIKLTSRRSGESRPEASR